MLLIKKELNKDIISKEVLGEVLGLKIWKIVGCEFNMLRYCIYPNKGDDPSEYTFPININELAHKCIIYAWDKMYDISPSVMGTQIVCLTTGFELHIIQRETILDPKLFDPRFTFKALQWLFDNEKIKIKT